MVNRFRRGNYRVLQQSLVEQRAEVVLEAARTTLESMGPVLGIQPEHPLHIVTYHNYRDMIGALPFRSRTTQEQLITKGMAFDEEAGAAGA